MIAECSFVLVTAWYVSVQVLETLGLAGLLTSLIMLLLYVFLPQWHGSKKAMSSLIAISYLSGKCNSL